MINSENNRRDFKRYQCDCPIKYKQNMDDDWQQSQCEDISDHGIKFQSKIPFKDDEILYFQIDSSDLKVAKIFKTRVAWSIYCTGNKDEFYFIGVEFISPSEDNQKDILFLKKLAPEFLKKNDKNG